MLFLDFKPVRHRAPIRNTKPLTTQTTNWKQPVVNILETKEGFRIELAAPGLQKNDINLKIEKNLLTISANKDTSKPIEGETWHRQEFGIGSFKRVFRLPENIDLDNVTANFTNGILVVQLVQIKEQKPTPKAIVVK